MKLALRILSYTLGGLTLIGMFSMASDYHLDVYELIAGLIVLAQVTVAIIYTYKS